MDIVGDFNGGFDGQGDVVMAEVNASERNRPSKSPRVSFNEEMRRGVPRTSERRKTYYGLSNSCFSLIHRVPFQFYRHGTTIAANNHDRSSSDRGVTATH